METLKFIGTGSFTGTGNDLTNSVTGGAGADTLAGLGGSDTLIGSAGADHFQFLNLTDSSVGAGDLIYDFTQADGDKIDLTSLFTQTGATFSFIASGNFSGAAGEVQAIAGGDGNTHIYADMTGTGSPDLEIVLNGAISLTGADFIH